MEGVLSWLKTNHINDADPALILEVVLVPALPDPDRVLVLDRQDRDPHIPVPSPNLNRLPARDHPDDHLYVLLEDKPHVPDRSLRQSRNPNLNPVLEADLAVALTREAVVILGIAADLIREAGERARKRVNHVLDHQLSLAKGMTEQLLIKIPKMINYVL